MSAHRSTLAVVERRKQRYETQQCGQEKKRDKGERDKRELKVYTRERQTRDEGWGDRRRAGAESYSMPYRPELSVRVAELAVIGDTREIRVGHVDPRREILQPDNMNFNTQVMLQQVEAKKPLIQGAKPVRNRREALSQ
jgi:hypothetical protein